MTREVREAVLNDCHKKVKERLGEGSEIVWKRIYEATLLLSADLDTVSFYNECKGKTPEEINEIYDKKTTSDSLFPFIHKLLMEME